MPRVRPAPRLDYQNIGDLYIRSALKQLDDYFNSENQLVGFKFIEIVFTAAETGRRVKHGILSVPKDLIRTQMTGSGVVTFHRDEFTDQELIVSATGPARVRLFAGTYFNDTSTVNTEPGDDEQWSASVS